MSCLYYFPPIASLLSLTFPYFLHCTPIDSLFCRFLITMLSLLCYYSHHCSPISMLSLLHSHCCAISLIAALPFPCSHHHNLITTFLLLPFAALPLLHSLHCAHITAFLLLPTLMFIHILPFFFAA